MITPDDVRGKYKTLEEAVLKAGWPGVEESRGKVMFLLDQERVGPLYTKGHPSLDGRVLFTNATPGTPDAAFVKMNDPLKGEIQKLVRKGYMVRTMSDPGVTRRDAALASGAQMVSTDYPFDEKAAGSGYAVRFPEPGIARCNPVLKPAAACYLIF